MIDQLQQSIKAGRVVSFKVGDHWHSTFASRLCCSSLCCDIEVIDKHPSDLLQDLLVGPLRRELLKARQVVKDVASRLFHIDDNR